MATRTHISVSVPRGDEEARKEAVGVVQSLITTDDSSGLMELSIGSRPRYPQDVTAVVASLLGDVRERANERLAASGLQYGVGLIDDEGEPS